MAGNERWHVRVAGELLGFEDRGLFGRPVRLLGRFELADGIAGEPGAADGVAADLVHLESNAPPGGRSAFGLREQVCLYLEGDVGVPELRSRG